MEEDTSSPETPDALEVTEDVELFSVSSFSSPSLSDLPEPSGLPTRLSGYPEEDDEELKEQEEEGDLRGVYQQNQDLERKLRSLRKLHLQLSRWLLSCPP